MKPVLVHYINVGNLDHMDIRAYIEQIKNECNYDGEYHAVFIPVRGQDTKIECLNPIIFEDSREKRNFVNRLNGMTYKVDELINKIPYMSRNILLIERLERP